MLKQEKKVKTQKKETPVLIDCPAYSAAPGGDF
jgi:hypothetical protein